MKPAISDLPQNSKEGTPSMDGSPLSVSKGDIPGGQTDIVRMRSEVPGVITRRRGCVPLRVRIYSSSDVECDLNPSRYVCIKCSPVISCIVEHVFISASIKASTNQKYKFNNYMYTKYICIHLSSYLRSIFVHV